MIGKLVLVLAVLITVLGLVGMVALAYVPQMTSKTSVAVDYSTTALVWSFLALPIVALVVLGLAYLKGAN